MTVQVTALQLQKKVKVRQLDALAARSLTSLLKLLTIQAVGSVFGSLFFFLEKKIVSVPSIYRFTFYHFIRFPEFQKQFSVFIIPIPEPAEFHEITLRAPFRTITSHTHIVVGRLQ